ncbi:MAG: hypothetical protein ACI4XI_06315 [Ruminococcus sp.]
MTVSGSIQILLSVMGIVAVVTALLHFKKDNKIVKTVITVLSVIILILGIACLGLSVYWCFEANAYLGIDIYNYRKYADM